MFMGYLGTYLYLPRENKKKSSPFFSFLHLSSYSMGSSRYLAQVAETSFHYYVIPFLY